MPYLAGELPPEIPALLDAFAEGLASALGERLVGLYLFGSALSDDFASASSDLDFLGVTEGPLAASDVAALEDLHSRLAAANAWGARLEGGYAARDALRPWGIDGHITAVGPEQGFQPNAASDYSADNMAALREASLAIVGPPAAEVVPEVDHATLEAGLRGYLSELLARPSEPTSDEDLAAWALNVARCLYGIATGRTSTKREAASWLSALAPELASTLAASLAVRAGTATADDVAVLRACHDELARQAARWGDPSSEL